MQYKDTPISSSRGAGCQGQIQTDRMVNPNESIEDYSRVMLQYTHKRMSSFTDVDQDKRSPSASSRSSGSSGSSGKSGARAMASVPGPGGACHDSPNRSQDSMDTKAS
ncbi:uncharacterized protein BDW47DRAFT_122098 [Aspergillus candidus]|uniref:Uncharacterized protein n=1 Tax=Aspergillus candidus TaxID=41067 RepID=A0A2I2FNX9_ASPCN|nr:hypothetical protein BDW47DRAFT_122098 [Aspergillus candidus]PLB42334.1 hypothetical protein BDW47DRAFT_122098 [Aspergillus candidus]